MDNLNPQSFTRHTLDELRQIQSQMEERLTKPLHPVEVPYNREYWNRVWTSKQTENITLLQVCEVFKYFINEYEIKKNLKWDKTRNREQYKEIIRYLHQLLTGEEREKGLLLVGDPGIGKTTIMRYFFVPTFMAFTGRIISLIPSDQILYQREDLISNSYGQCILDDLGMEMNYVKPEKSGWILTKQDISDQVYNILDKRRIAGNITHATTNIPMSGMVSIYGARAQWRFERMFLVVRF